MAGMSEDRFERLWRLWPLWCLLPLLGWWLTGLTDLDEGFYGAVAADMLRRGDWITPSISGVPWFEKPILIYWFAIPFIHLFGEDIGPRLPAVLATLASAWLIFHFGRAWFGEREGRMGALVFSGSLVSVALGRMMLTDALLVASLIGCFGLFWESLRRNRPNLRIGAAACLGLAVLAKGPVGGLFFLLIAGIVFWRMPSLRPAYRGGWLLSILAFFVVVSTWYLPCWLINRDEFVQKFLIEQNLGRFAGGDLAHRVPWFLHPIYFPVVAAVGLLPWLPSAWRQGLFSPIVAEDSQALSRRFLWIWALTIMIFFTISGSKLPHYGAPFIPPLAMLAGFVLVRDLQPDRLIRGAVAWSVFVLVLANVGFWIAYDSQHGRELHGVAREMRRAEEPNLVLYRFGRTERKVEIQLEMNETSRPSVHFYLRRPALKTSELAEIRDLPSDFRLMTPQGRFTTEDQAELEQAGWTLTQMRQGRFEEWSGRRPTSAPAGG